MSWEQQINTPIFCKAGRKQNIRRDPILGLAMLQIVLISRKMLSVRFLRENISFCLLSCKLLAKGIVLFLFTVGLQNSNHLLYDLEVIIHLPQHMNSHYEIYCSAKGRCNDLLCNTRRRRRTALPVTKTPLAVSDV